MKLLTIMAALLISFSAFSQDLIEYRDFKFYQNGAEISIEEVTELTKEYGVSKVAFRQGRRDYAASQNSLIMTRRNLTNGTLTILCYGGAFSSFAIGYLQATGGWCVGRILRLWARRLEKTLPHFQNHRGQSCGALRNQKHRRKETLDRSLR